MMAIAPASFDIYLPVKGKLYPIGVGCSVALSIPKAMREPDNRIKQIQFPHLFYYFTFRRGTRKNISRL